MAKANAAEAAASREMGAKLRKALQTGAYVAVILAVFTIAEYFFATEVSDNVTRVSGLFIVAVIKAYLIVLFFMHIKRAFQPEAH